MDATEAIEKIKQHAKEYAKTHATDHAKMYYLLGKKDAAATFLAMVRSDGANAAIQDVAKEILKHEPDHPHAKWIIEHDEWKS